MSNEKSQEGQIMSEDERTKANKFLIQFLESTMQGGRNEVIGLRSRLAFTYWIIIVLSIIMFGLGIVLLSVPAISAFQEKNETAQSLIAGGFGIADLAALFLFRPVERIHKLMGDMSQITLAINSFQEQTALRLLEIEKDKRNTIGEAAEHIKLAAKESIGLIQTYFEESKLK